MQATRTKVALGVGLLLVLGFLAAFGGYVFGNYLQNSLQTTVDQTSDAELQRLCEADGGKWVGEYKECEGISEATCSNNNGDFDSCGSACRHATDPSAPCTLQCVAVCAFDKKVTTTDQVEETDITVSVTSTGYARDYEAPFVEQETALDLMKRLREGYGFNFKTESFSFGELVAEINGVKPEANKEFWAFKVNGKDSDIGISQYMMKKGDRIEFVITALQN